MEKINIRKKNVLQFRHYYGKVERWGLVWGVGDNFRLPMNSPQENKAMQTNKPINQNIIL